MQMCLFFSLDPIRGTRYPRTTPLHSVVWRIQEGAGDQAPPMVLSGCRKTSSRTLQPKQRSLRDIPHCLLSNFVGHQLFKIRTAKNDDSVMLMLLPSSKILKSGPPSPLQLFSWIHARSVVCHSCIDRKHMRFETHLGFKNTVIM